MRVIWKFKVLFGGGNAIELPNPNTAKVIHFGMDGMSDLCLWAEVDSHGSVGYFHYEVYPTGGSINAPNNVHRGTAFEPPGYIWHLYTPDKQA